ncbi:hypothetical protein RUM43_000944 [Polyplax serrata]|uniref:Uncharacterized protein n=1 Tax=Polyplax serrata TaxID=468196 RepID=A0AAN8SFG3_POLSC
MGNSNGGIGNGGRKMRLVLLLLPLPLSRRELGEEEEGQNKADWCARREKQEIYWVNSAIMILPKLKKENPNGILTSDFHESAGWISPMRRPNFDLVENLQGVLLLGYPKKNLLVLQFLQSASTRRFLSA